MTYPIDRDLWSAVVAHGLLSVALLYAPLLAAAHLAAPGEPLFGGSLAVLAPVYYLAALAVIAAPSVQSMRSPPESGPARSPAVEDGAVGDLQRRYLDDDLTEAELEDRLEQLLEE